MAGMILMQKLKNKMESFTKEEFDNLPDGDDRVELSIGTLYSIYLAAFNHGMNDPIIGGTSTFDAFHKLIQGKPYLKSDNSSWDIADKIKITSNKK